MLSLGEAIGVLGIPNHAQMKIDKYAEYLWTDQEKLFSKIQDALGFSLELPPVGRPPVFEFNATNTNADLIKHAYAAHRIKEMKFKPTDAILEIGGGFGALAMLVYRAGYTNYTIIDLPVVGSIQHFYLASVFGVENVSGFGGPKRNIQILPPASFKGVSDKSLALVVNTDSFSEIDKSAATKYLTEIKRTADYFLSINQEAQAIHEGFGSPQIMVSELIKEVGGFERVYRFPYWMLEGYVEELYRVVRK